MAPVQHPASRIAKSLTLLQTLLQARQLKQLEDKECCLRLRPVWQSGNEKMLEAMLIPIASQQFSLPASVAKLGETSVTAAVGHVSMEPRFTQSQYRNTETPRTILKVQGKTITLKNKLLVRLCLFSTAILPSTVSSGLKALHVFNSGLQSLG